MANHLHGDQTIFFSNYFIIILYLRIKDQMKETPTIFIYAKTQRIDGNPYQVWDFSYSLASIFIESMFAIMAHFI